MLVTIMFNCVGYWVVWSYVFAFSVSVK